MSNLQCSFKKCNISDDLGLLVLLGLGSETNKVSGNGVAVATGADACAKKVKASNIENDPVSFRAYGRVEIRATLPKIEEEDGINFVVAWNKKGDAVFHSDCWDHVLEMSKKRGKSSSNNSRAIVMTTIEKKMVKEAAETAEYHDSDEKVEGEASRISDLIKSAKHAVVFTGAGISTSAGIGDFRGKSGKWTEQDRQYNPEDDKVEEPEAKRLKKDDDAESSADSDVEDGVPYEDLRPTYTHEAIVTLMKLGYIQYVISQNGDGLHLLSGIPQDKISELHGNVFLEKCEVCDERYERSYYVMDDVGSQYYEELEDYGKSVVKKPKHAKRCNMCSLSHRTGRKCEKKKCRGHLIDTIINFRDHLEDEILERATNNAKACDLMICLGTTLTVTPASHLVRKGRKPLRVVICNRQETDMDSLCSKKTSRIDDTPLGSRVFGDCDRLMRKIMKILMPADDLEKWEDGKKKRMGDYCKKRK